MESFKFKNATSNGQGLENRPLTVIDGYACYADTKEKVLHYGDEVLVEYEGQGVHLIPEETLKFWEVE